jgi:hypothetical protein
VEKSVLVILVSKRNEQVFELQKTLTQYGSIIKTRLGIHDGESSEGGDFGLIILEIVGDKVKKDELQKAIQKHKGIQSKLVSLSV